MTVRQWRSAIIKNLSLIKTWNSLFSFHPFCFKLQQCDTADCNCRLWHTVHQNASDWQCNPSLKLLHAKLHVNENISITDAVCLSVSQSIVISKCNYAIEGKFPSLFITTGIVLLLLFFLIIAAATLVSLEWSCCSHPGKISLWKILNIFKPFLHLKM